jgi:hypothetical protein
VQRVSEISTLILTGNELVHGNKILKYIFFLNIEVIQLKSEKEKTNARKLSLVFLLTYAQRLTAAPVTVTYNDKGGREKRESYGRY